MTKALAFWIIFFLWTVVFFALDFYWLLTKADYQWIYVIGLLIQAIGIYVSVIGLASELSE